MKIDKDRVPSTVLQAVAALVASLSEEDKEFIRKNGDSTHSHFGAGMSIRNNWSLWEKNTKLVQDAVKTYKIAHADDICGLIFAWAYAAIRNEDFDPMEHVEKYHKHWAANGQTSLEAGGVTG